MVNPPAGGAAPGTQGLAAHFALDPSAPPPAHPKGKGDAALEGPRSFARSPWRAASPPLATPPRARGGESVRRPGVSARHGRRAPRQDLQGSARRRPRPLPLCRAAAADAPRRVGPRDRRQRRRARCFAPAHGRLQRRGGRSRRGDAGRSRRQSRRERERERHRARLAGGVARGLAARYQLARKSGHTGSDLFGDSR